MKKLLLIVTIAFFTASVTPAAHAAKGDADSKVEASKTKTKGKGPRKVNEEAIAKIKEWRNRSHKEEDGELVRKEGDFESPAEEIAEAAEKPKKAVRKRAGNKPSRFDKYDRSELQGRKSGRKDKSGRKSNN